MASLMQNASQPSSAPLPPDLEPDDQWKQELKLNIEAGLRSMVDEAKQKRDDELAKGIIGPEERDRLTAEHLATLRTIRQLAEEQFRIALERERQERRWASGEQLDQVWSESMMKEQQAIMDRIERERKASITSSQSGPPHLPPLPQALAPPPPPPPVQFHSKPDVPSESATPTPVPSNRKPNRLARSPTYNVDLDGGPYFSHSTGYERDDLPASPDDIPSAFRPTRKVRAGSVTSMGSWKAPSFLESEKSFLERSRPMPIYDEPESMSRSARTPTDPLDPTRKESIRRKPSMSARSITQEFWKPSITPEEDAQMSRTFTLARRSSNASNTSSFKAHSVLSATFSDPLDVLSNANNIDRERASIHSADQEWAGMDRARDRDRDRDRSGYYGDDRTGFTQFPATSPPNSATYARAGSDISRVHAPPPSASRPIVNKRSFTSDDTFLPQSSSPSTRHNWPSSSSSVSRSPYETRWDGASSRSPQTPDEVVPRSWQSSQLRGRFSTQDMRHHFQSEGGYYRARTHHHEDFGGGGGGGGEDGSDDGFDTRSWRTRPVDYNERRIQDIEEGLRKREEAANKREEELARKAEELKREDDERQKLVERMEEEAKAREEDEAELKEAELRRKEEEAERKEREAAVKEEEARKKEEEAKKKEQEAKKKEQEARQKEQEAKRREKEAKSREQEAKRKEEELKKKERDATSREMEARRKEEDARRKEEEVKLLEEEARRKDFEARRKQEEAERKEEEARRRSEEASLRTEEMRKKEDELRRREDELRRREEELNRRESDMRRKEDDKLQDDFRKREEDIRRQRADERRKNEVWETWPQETFRPTPSPQTPNSSGPWPIPNPNERSGPTVGSSPIDRVSTGSSVRSTPVSGWSSASTRSSSTSTSATSTQSSGTPKPTGPSTSTPKPPPSSSTPVPPLTEAEFHRRQAEQAQQREEQFRREQARFAMQEHERQTKAGKTMSKEEVTKLFEAHRHQWDKMQTMGSLIWEDFPWPMFKRPKGPDDLTSPGITAYMLSPVHPQDRATKERIKDNIRRWHPDRFNSQLLPKVKESERERVSEGAGSVARILNDLLRMHSQDVF